MGLRGRHRQPPLPRARGHSDHAHGRGPRQGPLSARPASRRGPARPRSAGLEPWAHWDGVWFVRIAADGYGAHAQSQAFFPLYPLLVRGAAVVTGDTTCRRLRRVAGLLRGGHGGALQAGAGTPRPARGALERGVHLRVPDGALLSGRLQRVALPAAHAPELLVGARRPLGARRPGGAAGRAHAQQRRAAPAAARGTVVGAAPRAGYCREGRSVPSARPLRRRRATSADAAPPARRPPTPRRGCSSCPPASLCTWRTSGGRSATRCCSAPYRPTGAASSCFPPRRSGEAPWPR